MPPYPGVNVDNGPQSGKGWLDRGELQILIDASIAQLPARPITAQPAEGNDQGFDQRWHSFPSDQYRRAQRDTTDSNEPRYNRSRRNSNLG